MSIHEEPYTTFGQKITNLLRDDPSPPDTMFCMAFWLLRHMTTEDQNLLHAIELEFGEDNANRWLVRQMVASGKYKSDDGESVERA